MIQLKEKKLRINNLFKILIQKPFHWEGFFYFCTMLLFIGGSEIFFVILFVVMLFGAKKIPEIAKGLGKMMREVKDASNEIKREIKDSAKEIKDSTKDIKDNIDKEING